MVDNEQPVEDTSPAVVGEDLQSHGSDDIHHHKDGVEMTTFGVNAETTTLQHNQDDTAIQVNPDLNHHIREYTPDNKTGMYVSARNLNYYVDAPKPPKNATPEQKKINLLNDFTFSLKPGRMVLLMGAPSSGKSILLRVLANRLGKGHVEGELLFNGHPADPETHHKDTIYVPQEDRHIPLLTVKETLDFSAQCNMGSTVNQSTKDERVELILSQLGLSHTKNTIIGNEFFRGISGGQKRRVTVANEFTKCPNLILMDEPTTGLDSATAFSVCSKVRTIANEAKASAMISLLQPSPELTNLFDDVMLLGEKGKICYFGPRESLLSYFESIGYRPLLDQPLAEFMQEIVEDPLKYAINRDTSNGELSNSIANSEIHLDTLFKQSNIYQENINNLTTLLPTDVKLHDFSKVENPLSPMWYDIKLCMERQKKIMRILRMQFITRFIQATFMGFVVGSLFFQMGDTQADGRNRFGLLYFATVLHIWTTFSSVDEFYQLRSIYYDQKDGKFYRTFAYFITVVVSKFPIALIEAFLFSVTCYWISGFRARADTFIVFIICMALTNVIAQGVFQSASSFSDSQLVTSMVTPAVVILFMIFSGYILPGVNIPNWWIWMYYLSPLKYVLDALASNEMYGRSFTCTPNEVIPPASHPLASLPYPQGFANHSICPMQSGSDFLNEFGFNNNFYWRWIDIAIVIGFAIALFTAFYIGITYVKFETKKPPRAIQQKKVKAKKDKKADKKKQLEGGCYMTFSKLGYTVEAKRNNPTTNKKETVTLQLLKDVNGYVKPGTMLALMGPSGAGKSTLLDVLSKRKNMGVITGDIQINGANIFDLNITRFTGYVEQQDILSGNLTVREAIYFSALCRLPDSYLNADKLKLVDEILHVLSLTKLQDTKIGPNPTMGISLANRKKVSIGIELASNPHLLFLDEPTSGLDSAAALKVMNCVRKIALSGRTVICTIHQPSQEIFEQFDQLLLLGKGEVVYFGETGVNSQTVLDYFAKQGHRCQADRNPSDFILEIAEHNPTEPIAIYTASEEAANTAASLLNKTIVPSTVEVPKFKSRYNASLSTQLYVLTKRAWINHIRRPQTILIRFCRSLIPSIVVGTMFLRLDNDQSGARNKLAMIYLSFLFGGMASISKIPLVIEDRSVYYREFSSGAYPSFLYIIAAVITDLPFICLTAFCFWIPFFWLTGMDPGHNGWKFFFTLLVYLLIVMAYDNLAMVFALVLPTIPIAVLLSGMGLNFLGLFGGFFIPRVNIPSGWIWMHWLTFTKYAFETLGVTELKDATFNCPGGKGEYLIPVGNTTKPFCPITNGNTMIARYGLNVDRQFWNVLVLVCFNFGFIMLSYLALRFIHHMKR
ncbi:ABC transporter G family protein [Heterostelium album PN500]|uniref:ABC transporter G family protein n=1 Tax=Heterostelium pallidum (strain ATCC 26659 / Pp 5 / PN500) TaxID=670386 RepID=D3B1H6_HETP5|nr:ABC transporter G family protein [Heterostelium album PN500]EFA85150.1 ABC transporter G family protein [Heterostelium album PN500]|eukprot:XP_020437259.1 ABC transporter G family protein [Heterostelium album PN500]